MTKGDADAPHVHIQMLSQPRYLCGARELILATMSRFGFNELGCSQIALAVDEALANVICHGYERRPTGKIWVSIWPLDESTDGDVGGARIIIEDEARQVDPDQIKGRDLDKVRPGGLGVHIIREVMDHVEYTKRDACGMRLVLEKRIDLSEDSDSSDSNVGDDEK